MRYPVWRQITPRRLEVLGLHVGRLALFGFAPIFGVFIAIAIASLVEQWQTQTPGRPLRAISRAAACRMPLA